LFRCTMSVYIFVFHIVIIWFDPIKLFFVHYPQACILEGPG